jgi:predicted nucleic acid-binding protein
MIPIDSGVGVDFPRKQPAAGLDVLIAQAAIALGVPLHTFNIRHFRAVSRLPTVQACAR